MKYFEDLQVESVYLEGDGLKRRTFKMGKQKQIIVDEKIFDASELEISTTVSLLTIKNKKSLNKQLSTIARSLVEKLLPYFIYENYTCPKISLFEANGLDPIILNSYVIGNNALIKEIEATEKTFSISKGHTTQNFSIRVFKIYSPKKQRSKVSLIAHKREVTETAIHNYIPRAISF